MGGTKKNAGSEAEPLLATDDEQPAAAEPGLTVLNASILLANTCIGSGVLSFPFAFSKVGIVLALVLFFGFAVLLSFTLHIIVRSLAIVQRHDPTVKSYEALVQLAGGHRLALFMEVRPARRARADLSPHPVRYAAMQARAHTSSVPPRLPVR
jgi:hypothetical protein